MPHSKFGQRIPLQAGRELASGIPDATFVALDSRNHILIAGEPAWKACVDSVRAFLADLGP